MKQLSSVLKFALYRLKNVKYGKCGQVDTHHIYPKSRIETGFKVHDVRNLIKMNHIIHFGLHDIFINCTPQEQLMVWAEVNKQVLSDKVQSLVQELFDLEEREFYRKELLK